MDHKEGVFNLKASLSGLYEQPILTPEVLAALAAIDAFRGIRVRDHLKDDFIKLLAQGCVDQATQEFDASLFEGVIEANREISKAILSGRPF